MIPKDGSWVENLKKLIWGQKTAIFFIWKYSPFHAISRKVRGASWCVAVRDPIRSGKLSNLGQKASGSDPVAVKLFLHDFQISRFFLENFHQNH